jgi:hypothetical protein
MAFLLKQKQTAARQGRRKTEGTLLRNQNSTASTDFQITPNCFVEAERHIGMAVDLIEKGRSDSATVSMKTCGLMLDLLAGVRTPLRRLGSVALETGAPSFERELDEVSR